MEPSIPRHHPTEAPAAGVGVSAASSATDQAPEIQIYIDGKFYSRENAKVSVFDHALLYGDGVFEGIRVYDGCIFRLTEHLERLYDSAHYIMLQIPIDKDEMTEAVAETVRRSGIHDGYIRLVVTRGVGTLGLDPWKCKVASVVIIADTIRLYPEEVYRDGLKLITVPTMRSRAEILNGRVKSLNYLNNILAKIEAKNSGYEEALMLEPNGFVVECTGDNVFLVKKRVVFTPPVYLGALNGVTRLTLMEVAREKGYEVREEPFTRYEVFTADEVFLTGTAAEALPVIKVDERVIGTGKPGPVTTELIAGFRARTRNDGYQAFRK